MIPEFDRYHGIVLRQMLVAIDRRASLSVVNISGRIDSFSLDGAAFQIKHSSKRLSPWYFTYLPEHLGELVQLRQRFDPVWAFLVCGTDGVVGLSFDEIISVLPIGKSAVSLRVSRNRNSMYRLSGPLGELDRAKRRGVHEFVQACLLERIPGE